MLWIVGFISFLTIGVIALIIVSLYFRKMTAPINERIIELKKINTSESMILIIWLEDLKEDIYFWGNKPDKYDVLLRECDLYLYKVKWEYLGRRSANQPPQKIKPREETSSAKRNN